MGAPVLSCQKPQARRHVNWREHGDRLATLTPREREAFREVAHGRLNKQAAYDLGISEGTVTLHRGSVMRTMETASVGKLIRAWEALHAAKARKPRTHGFP